MATKQFYHDIDLVLVGQFKGRVYNITTSARTTLASSLNTTHKGLHVWDTDLNYQFYWDGTAWVSGVQPVVGAMVYKGAYSSLTTTPTDPQIGHVYVLTVAGTLTWSGQTFLPNAVVQVNDQVVYRGSNTWDVLQGDADEATTTTLGLVTRATQSEVNAGTDQTKYVSSETLTGFVNFKQFAKTFFQNTISLTADTPFTVTHNLGLSNLNAFVVSVKDSTNKEIGVAIEAIDVNSFTITAGVTLSNVKVMTIGF